MREQSYLFALAQGATRRRDTGCFIQQATRHAGLCLMVDNRKLAIISGVSNTFVIMEIRDRLGVGFQTGDTRSKRSKRRCLFARCAACPE